MLRLNISRQALRQAAAPQPPLIVIWLPILLLPTIPHLVSAVLMLAGYTSRPVWEAFPHAYGYGRFIFNLLLISVVMWLLVSRHRSAFWTGWQVNWRGTAWAFAVWIGVLSLQSLPTFIKFAGFMSRLFVEGHPDDIALVREAYHEFVLPRSAYGATAAGLVLSVLMAVLGQPVFEEVLFSAILANRFVRRHRLWLALLATPLLFTMVHVLFVGGSQTTWPAFRAWFAMGFCYLLMRLLSGNILLSCGLHSLYNLIAHIPSLTILFVEMNYREGN